MIVLLGPGGQDYPQIEGETRPDDLHAAAVTPYADPQRTKPARRSYKGRAVVNDVSVQINQGEIVGLLGTNGAGKTTSFYMMVGLVTPDGGRVTLDGKDITRLPMYQRARHGLGYLAQEPSAFRKLTTAENIMLVLEMLPGLSRKQRVERRDHLLETLRLTARRDSLAQTLSGGERRRVEIARVLATRPLHPAG